MNHDDIRQLLGAYALDAVDPDERDVIDAHLEECPSCLSEVINHREMAALMATTPELDEPFELPSPELWGAIAASTLALDNVVPLAAARVKSRDARRRATVWGSLAAVFLLVVASLSVEVGHLHQQVGSLQHQSATGSLSAQLTAAIHQPGHRTIYLDAANGSERALAVLTKGGTAYFVNKDLSPLSANETFQLWAVSNGHVISLGVMGANPKVESFHVEPTMSQLLVNVEPAGGTVTPTTPVLAQADVPRTA